MSKEYAKLRKEVQRRKPTKLDRRKVQEHNRTAAPYYVIAESSYPSTAKSHRTPGTFGTTRQFTGNPSDPSTNLPTTVDKERTTKILDSTTGFKATTPMMNKTSSIPANSSSAASQEAITTTTDRRSTEEYSTTDLLTELISTIRDNLLENTVDPVPITAEDTKGTTEQYPTDRDTTPKLTSTTILSFKGGTNKLQQSNSTTITNVVTTTDCINASASNNPLTEEAEASSTEFNIASNEITRTDDSSTTEDASSTETEERSTLAAPSNDVTEVDLESKVNVNAITTFVAPKISPDLEHLLNITISKNVDYGEYDYNEPTLPPSLPNLQ